jgi:uncharacterized protein
MRVIADTGFLIALIGKKDQFRDWARELARRVDWPVLTCEAVLAETAFHLQSSERVVGMLRDNLIQIAFDCASHREHLYYLAARYADRRPDLADLCLIRMSEMYPDHVVITVDEEDFRVYRRNKREAIPLLCPPKR